MINLDNIEFDEVQQAVSDLADDRSADDARNWLIARGWDPSIIDGFIANADVFADAPDVFLNGVMMAVQILDNRFASDDSEVAISSAPIGDPLDPEGVH